MLDMSGSMFSRFIRAADLRRCRSSTRSLPQDRAQIGTFGEEIAISPHLTGDKEMLRRVLRNELWPMGGTPIWNALDAAMSASDVRVRPPRRADASPTARTCATSRIA